MTKELAHTQAQPLVPGVYPGLPFSDYLAIDAASSTGLRKFMRSPARFKWGKDEATKAKSLGSLAHCVVLEPDEVASRYKVVEGKWNLKGPRDAKMAAIAAGYEPVHETEMDAARGMSASFKRDPKCRKLLSGLTDIEFTLVWEDKATGVPCKARVDGYSRTGEYLLDVKTSKHAYKFADNFGPLNDDRLDIQMAFYRRGLLAHGLPVKAAFWLVCENTHPHEAGAYGVGMGCYETGEAAIDRILPDFAKCEAAGEWPAGLPGGFQMVDTSEYIRRIELPEEEGR